MCKLSSPLHLSLIIDFPKINLAPSRPDRFWDPPSLASNGYWGLFSPGVKRPGCESDHCPPISAENQDYVDLDSSTHPYVFMA
jgi:hypothetical protein